MERSPPRTRPSRSEHLDLHACSDPRPRGRGRRSRAHRTASQPRLTRGWTRDAGHFSRTYMVDGDSPGRTGHALACEYGRNRLPAGSIHGTEERGNFVIEARNERGQTWPILSGVSVLRREQGVQFIDRRLGVRNLVVNGLRCPFHHALNAGPERLIGRDPRGG